MSPISPNSSPRPPNAQNALGVTQDNANAIPQGPSGETCTAAASSSGWSLLTKPFDWVQTIVLPILQPSLAKQRWDAWVNACNISAAEQKQRQALAARLEGRIEFNGEHIKVRRNLLIE